MAKAGFSTYLEERCPLPKSVPGSKMLTGQKRLSREAKKNMLSTHGKRT
jgi:phage FluMu protein Com